MHQPTATLPPEPRDIASGDLTRPKPGFNAHLTARWTGGGARN